MSPKYTYGLTHREDMRIHHSSAGWTARSVVEHTEEDISRVARTFANRKEPYRLIFSSEQVLDLFLREPAKDRWILDLQQYVSMLRSVRHQSLVVTEAELARMVRPVRAPWYQWRRVGMDALLTGASPRRYSLLMDAPHFDRRAVRSLVDVQSNPEAAFGWLKYLDQFSRIQELLIWENFVAAGPEVVESFWAGEYVEIEDVDQEPARFMFPYALVQEPGRKSVILLRDGDPLVGTPGWRKFEHRSRLRSIGRRWVRVLMVQPEMRPRGASFSRRPRGPRVLPVDVLMAGRAGE